MKCCEDWQAATVERKGMRIGLFIPIPVLDIFAGRVVAGVMNQDAHEAQLARLHGTIGELKTLCNS